MLMTGRAIKGSSDNEHLVVMPEMEDAVMGIHLRLLRWTDGMMEGSLSGKGSLTTTTYHTVSSCTPRCFHKEWFSVVT